MDSESLSIPAIDEQENSLKTIIVPQSTNYSLVDWTISSDASRYSINDPLINGGHPSMMDTENDLASTLWLEN